MMTGNYVSAYGIVSQIVEIKYSFVRLKYMADGKERHSFVDYDRLEPIKLTEVILLNCGFDTVGFGDHNAVGFVGFRHGIWDVYMCDDNKIYVVKNTTETEVCEINYLHELQNLYYSLTKKQLQYEQV
ncbi:hypothetical protein [Polluticaenibacter yanchengensis]|uniref:SMI1/KNR4 family protein n=1 Tax=Polluticaenibacter yanchengensis TaxID=3014562 RepID=A0ABT4UIS0_9BACT|nr:hypothetical protein [Chitinophagaceae bacterium LY-5]